MKIDLGCSPAALERLFEARMLAEGMKPDDRGTRWDIVTKHPLAYFNLSNAKERAIASHYTNFKLAWNPRNRPALDTYDPRFEWAQQH